MSEFTPAELDALEDALEGLEEAAPSAEAPGRSPAVVTRLEEYRAILQASREAMPMQEVPAGLLDAVLDEAKAAAAKPVAAPKPPKQSWWKRLRGTFILPAAALAGTAALLLVVIYPKGEDTAALEAGPATARSEPQPEAAAAPEQSPIELGRETQQLADAYKQDQAAGEFDADASRGKGMPGAVLEDADDAEIEEKRAEEEAPARDDGLLGGRTRSDEQAKSSSRSRAAKPKPSAPAKNKKEAPAADPFAEPAEPEPAPAPKTGGKKAPSGGGSSSGAESEDTATLRTAVDKGDAHRRAGKCGLARLQYNKAQAATDPKLRARALAGLGLCEHAEGRPSAADTYFAKARSADPTIQRYIDAELTKARK